MNQPKKPTSPFKNKNFIIVLVMLLMLFVLFPKTGNDYNKEITRTDFLALMGDSTKVITELSLQKTPDGVIIEGAYEMTPEEIAEAKKNQSAIARFTRASSDTKHKHFKSHMLEVSNEQISTWETFKGVKVKVIHESTTWIETLIGFLPAILLIAFFYIMMSRQMGGGGKSPFSFGKSQVRQLTSQKKTTFNDVAGCDEAKQDLQELVEFLKDPKKYDKLGGRIPKGALLVGPPGTGKTLLARAVAGEAGVPFFSMSGSDFVEMFVGVGASRVRDLFETGKKNAPCILFIDEIDAVGRQRGAGLGGGHDEREQTLNQLLVEMDGFTANEGVILIAATNRPDVLDKALLRPGRFDRQIVVGLPDLKGREEILKVHLKKRKVPLGDDVDVKAVAKGTPGLAGADLENLVNEAALLAARFNNKKVTMLDFEEARDKLSMGAERRTLLMTDEEKRHTAYHEAGHALMTLLCKHSDPLHKITIIPRGRALGVTMSLPERDQVSYSREYAEERIMIMMSGRLAELIFFNHQSTGASNDIQRATELARKMVTEWGFDEEIGPVCYSRADGEVFLGREISKPKEMSEMMAEKIDNAINGLIKRMDAAARKLLEENKDKLIDLAEALFEFEVLDREEIDKVMAGEKLTGTKKSRQYKAMEELAKKREEENTPPPDPGDQPPVAPITDVQPAPATGNETATNSVKETEQQ
ncbi:MULTISPECIES: ATP-dependent zinc metalloprotease FtsH [unclassified Fibrobacter]|uniref:ATP-dependent zinc metalloprotease FtsH n=1 Tax=unclassified Fibrobacter TaxID=2634177 RepID=UPI00090FD575|nr:MULTISPECIES: ATP-dependent zinc metalloprotease FtsH [unclassified Fibrobacter]SHK66984.1 membrane protease FtsH catalytic subunit [Fibrobacter sp. UWB12]SIO05709.1 membrane protease FtsH catalytic subunit [Fibrobacter sp. UWB11]